MHVMHSAKDLLEPIDDASRVDPSPLFAEALDQVPIALAPNAPDFVITL